MEKMHTFGIQFVIRKHRIKNGEAPIYARITVNSERTEISVKKRINVDNWNNGKGMAKGKNPDISLLNSYLEQFRSKLTSCYQSLVINGEQVDANNVKNRFLGNEPTGKTLLELIDYHNTQMKETLKWGTLKNYQTTAKYIGMYLQKNYVERISHFLT